MGDVTRSRRRSWFFGLIILWTREFQIRVTTKRRHDIGHDEKKAMKRRHDEST